VAQHHERYDGTGYPAGLKGGEICLGARIMAVADVWDALVSERPYREGWIQERARDLIVKSSGSHFDPDVVNVFLAVTAEE
jgi:putative two-component system response regulator